MADPSYGIQAELLRHMHLISSFHYPVQSHLGPEDALNLLLQAPRIVNEMCTMAWTYFNQAPGDGQLFLAWQPPRMQRGFATDGYIWADQESQFHQEIRGYTLEICVHRAGYAMNRDHQVASHTRFRYHIINKLPNVPGPPFDPLLWLVHYGPNDPQSRVPIQTIQMAPQVRQLIAERQYIEQQGGLQRKEFMLKDRPNWPQLSLGQRATISQMPVQHPAAASPAYAMAAMQARQNQQYYPPAVVQQPPAKRQRVNASQAHITNAIATGQIPDLIIEEEEGAALGDYLDNLTPADISKMRYKQHHEWMEEIYSSVFSISQIIPEDLGLGLTGKLKELTDGIFNTPSYDAMKAPFEQDKYAQKYKNAEDSLQRMRPKKERLLDTPPGSTRYQKLTPEKLEEFETRISSFMDSGREEIEAMKKAHAATVADFKKSKSYMVAERKLRDADDRTMEEIIADLEKSIGGKVVTQKDVVCIEEGGLEKEEKSRPPNGSREASANTNTNGAGNNFNGNGVPYGADDNSAAGLLDQFGSGSYEGTPVGRIPTPQLSQPQSGAPTPAATAGPSQGFNHQDDSGLDFIDGMDLDVPIEGLGESADTSDWLTGDNSAQPDTTSTPSDPNKPTSTSQIGQTQHSDTNPQGNSSSHQPPSTINESSAEGTHAAESGQQGDQNETPESATGMFHDADFGSFDNLDTAGDALADFDTGGDDDFGLDLNDDIAFGDTPEAGKIGEAA
ncbi:hypothetical protein FKW77_007755 [Venturia effusa]|uniref:DUF1750-domain-containing protein n=1 Tax=Venturia effusa TaxID=50376 RepID=A0A517L7R9_9PEZI|nr:hypothetical protein FKW77_007755 [Venturia effusa]